MNAVQYLRDLQKRTGTLVSTDTANKVFEHREGVLSKSTIQRIRNEPKFRSIEGLEEFYHNNLIKPFLETLPSECSNCLKDVYVGFLQTNDPNAWALQVPENGPLIVLHTSLIFTIGLYNELKFLIGPLMNKDIVSSNVLFQEGHRRILNIFQGFDYSIDSKKFPRQITKEDLIKATYLSMAQELFIVAHEFSHIYLGHLDRPANISLVFGDNRVTVRKYSRRQQEELDADILAVKWLSNVKNSNFDRHVAPFLILPSVSIGLVIEIFMLFNFIEINLGVPSASSSHPSSLIRLNHILKECSCLLTEQEKEFIKGMIMNGKDTMSWKLPNI